MAVKNIPSPQCDHVPDLQSIHIWVYKLLGSVCDKISNSCRYCRGRKEYVHEIRRPFDCYAIQDFPVDAVKESPNHYETYYGRNGTRSRTVLLCKSSPFTPPCCNCNRCRPHGIQEALHHREKHHLQ